MTEQDKIIEMANQAELCQCIWIDDEGPEIASLVAFAKLVAKAKAEEIATACERLPFGDTAHSFAVWIREQ